VGTGLIYGAIVLVWAAFLVPWALRRYDEAAHTRSIEKFSTAMRVLGRRDALEPTTLAAPRGLGEPPPEPARAAVAAPHPSRAAARAAAQRRRRTLLALLALTAVVLGLAMAGVVPLWAAVAPLALVLAWLAACRRQARRADDDLWGRQPAATMSPAAGTPRAAPTQPRVPRVRRAARVEAAYGGIRQPAGDDPNDEPTVVLAVDALVETETVAVPVATSDGSSLWHPLPVTLPTYVSKPRVARTVRTIELGEPGTWTSGHVEGEQTQVAEAEQPDAEEQRAVGS